MEYMRKVSGATRRAMCSRSPGRPSTERQALKPRSASDVQQVPQLPLVLGAGFEDAVQRFAVREGLQGLSGDARDTGRMRPKVSRVRKDNTRAS